MAMDRTKDEDERVDELVAMIDELMANGDGHVNVNAGEAAAKEGTLNVQTVRSSDCTMLGACCQPNEKSPEDEEE